MKRHRYYVFNPREERGAVYSTRFRCVAALVAALLGLDYGRPSDILKAGRQGL